MNNEKKDLMFWLFVGSSHKLYKSVVRSYISSLPPSSLSTSNACFNFVGGDWSPAVKIMLLMYAAPAASPAMSYEQVQAALGTKYNVLMWIMFKEGWLKYGGWKRYFVLTPKSIGLVEAILKDVERRYATFYTSQIELKRSRMKDLNNPL